MSDKLADQKIVKATIGDQIEGGYAQYTRLCTLVLADGSEKKAFIKLSKDGMAHVYFATMLKLHREAIFYNYIKNN